MKLKGIEIEAFRGYRDKVYFDFLTNSGALADIVVIYAPNGFGKTSFFDAVEWGLSDKINRFESKILANAASLGKVVLNNRDTEKVGEITYTDSEDKILTRRVKKTSKWDLHPGLIVSTSSSSLKNYFPVTSKQFNKSIVQILQQNAVDEFVFSTTPEDRYKSLTGFWDGHEDTKYFQGIAEMLECHNEELSTQEVKIRLKENEITTLSASTAQTDLFNSIIIKINLSSLVTSEMREIDLDQIDTVEKFEQLKQQYVQLAGRYTADQSINQNLISEILGLMEGHQRNGHDLRKIQTLKIQIDNHNNTLKNFYDLRKSDEKVERDIAKRDSLQINIEEVRTLSSNQKVYEEIKSALSTLKKERDEILQDGLSRASLLKDLRDQVTIRTNKTELLKREKESQSAIFQFLQNNRDAFLSNVLLEANGLTRSNACQQYLKKVELKQSDLTARELEIRSKIDFDQQQLIKELNEPSLITQRNLLAEKVLLANTKEKEIDSLERQYFKSGALNDNLQKIIAFGQSYVEETTTNSCPMCASQFDTFSDLLSAIKYQKNDVLDLDKQMETIDSLKNEIERIKQDAEQITNDIIQELNRMKNKVELENSGLRKLEQKILHWIRFYQNRTDHSKQWINTFRTNVGISQEEDIELRLISLRDRLKELDFDIVGKEKLVDETKNAINNLLDATQRSSDRVAEIDNLLNLERIKPIYQEINAILEKISKGREVSPEDAAELNASLTRQFHVLNEDIEKTTLARQTLAASLGEIRESEVMALKTKLEEELIQVSGSVRTFDSRLDAFLKAQDVVEDTDKWKVLNNLKLACENRTTEYQNVTGLINELIGHFELIEKNVSLQIARAALKTMNDRFDKLKEITAELSGLKDKVKLYIDTKVNAVFNQDIINDIYQKIDPHPELKEIKLDLDFSQLKPKLTIKAKKFTNNVEIDPILYLSSAQINILSLSIFLAKALQKGNSVVDTIFMDDPVQYLDSINILSFIDLLRVMISKDGIDRQVVISTHDDNFFRLLKKKFDPGFYTSKFIEFETYGKPRNA